MYVDDFGVHCIMLFGSEVFYTNWDSPQIVKIDVNKSNGQTTFSCCSITYVDDDDPNFFELVLGSDDGKVFLKTIMIEDVTPAKITLEIMD